MPDTIIKWNNQLLKWNSNLIRTQVGTVAPSDPWPTTGLVARWAFNDTLNDTGPNGLNQVMVAGTTTYGAAKSSGNCLSLNGSTTFAADSTTFNMFQSRNPWSVAYWRYADNVNTGIWCAWNQSSTAGNWIESFELPNNAGVEISVGMTAGVGTSVWSYTSQAIKLAWTHIVQMYDGDNIKTYINGSSSAATTTACTNSLSGVNRFAIGIYGDGNTPPTGKLEKLYIYSRAITTTEIATLYNSGTPL